MHIDCHKAKILHRWSANDGHLLSGAVLVEFTLRDDAPANQPMHSRLVEYVCLTIDPAYHESFKTRKLQRQACEQVRSYFNGEGKRENLFADTADQTPEYEVETILSPAQEAELQAELRLIEREFEHARLPTPETLARPDTRQLAPI